MEGSPRVNVYFPSLNERAMYAVKEIRTRWPRDRMKLWFYGGACRAASETVKRMTELVRDKAMIDENIRVDGSIQYYEWQGAQGVPLRDDMKALLCRSREYRTEFVIFSDDQRCLDQRTKGELVAFVDAPQKLELPDEFIKIRWISDLEELDSYCHEAITFNNLLADVAKFKKTSMVARIRQANTPVYKGVSGAYRGLYFYRDQFHIGGSRHCEVFDERKRHVGELLMSGVVDSTKADKTKHWPVAT